MQGAISITQMSRRFLGDFRESAIASNFGDVHCYMWHCATQQSSICESSTRYAMSDDPR